jgi:hypothetical protein
LAQKDGDLCIPAQERAAQAQGSSRACGRVWQPSLKGLNCALKRSSCGTGGWGRMGIPHGLWLLGRILQVSGRARRAVCLGGPGGFTVDGLGLLSS